MMKDDTAINDADLLPLRWNDNQVRVGKQVFNAYRHVPVLLFPISLNPPPYRRTGTAAQRIAPAGFFDEEWKPPAR